MNNYNYIALIPLLPLAGFVLLGLFGRKYLKKASGIIGTILLLASTILALYTAYNYFFINGKAGGSYQSIIALKFRYIDLQQELKVSKYITT